MGGMFTRFEDLDGNSFGLTGFDKARRGVEAQRRALVQKLENERRAGPETRNCKTSASKALPTNLASLPNT